MILSDYASEAIRDTVLIRDTLYIPFEYLEHIQNYYSTVSETAIAVFTVAMGLLIALAIWVLEIRPASINKNYKLLRSKSEKINAQINKSEAKIQMLESEAYILHIESDVVLAAAYSAAGRYEEALRQIATMLSLTNKLVQDGTIRISDVDREFKRLFDFLEHTLDKLKSDLAAMPEEIAKKVYMALALCFNEARKDTIREYLGEGLAPVLKHFEELLNQLDDISGDESD